MSAVVVIARVEALQNHEAEVEALLRSQVPPTRQERGCLNYDLHRDRDDPRVFWFHETWATDDDLAAHAQAAHLVANRARLAPHLARPTEVHRVTKLTP